MESLTSHATTSSKLRWAGRVMSALPVMLFIFSAAMKLIKHTTVITGFAHFGYSEKLILVFGVVELTCTALYAIPKTSVLGAILLTGYLGGAISTHLRIGEPVFAQSILGVLVWLGLYLRDHRIRALIPILS